MKICRAPSQDIPDIMKFLGIHWARSHILSSSRELMHWQHLCHEDEGCNYIVARENDELLGVLGYIPTSHYDPQLKDRDTLWLTTWLVKQDCKVPALGLSLHRYLSETIPHQGIGTVGNNAEVVPLYKALGHDCGELKQYFMLNDELAAFSLARVGIIPEALPPSSESTVDVAELCDPEELTRMIFHIGRRASALPTKSPGYFARRYLHHPFYTYRVFRLQQQSRNLGLIALRRVSHKGACALRLVDYWGDSAGLAASRSFLQDFLKNEKAEFIDVYNHGIRSGVFAAAGFHELQTEGLIIPNYFEPFERKNVRIRYTFKTPQGQGYIFFKADGDQDRPNLIS